MSSWQELITADKVLPLLRNQKIRIIDVRAPVEFQAGSIPFSVNLPIMNDDERAQVGTIYKQNGQEAAIALGHQLVQGKIKSARVQSWIKEFQKDPGSTLITCFRGGLRSQTAQKWLGEQGILVPRLAGGYKVVRQLLIQEIQSFSEKKKLLILTGKTGSGKTKLLRARHSDLSVDLEQLANHRGSAFGAFQTEQPSQIDFENHLALELSRKQNFSSPLLVEDESRMIGSKVIPDLFFQLMRQSSVLMLDEPLEVRIENTLQEYVVNRAKDPNLFSDLRNSLQKISRKLGGARYSEISIDLRNAEEELREHHDFSANRIWIEKLLNWYYDPLYEAALAKRKPHILAQGNSSQILCYLRDKS